MASMLRMSSSKAILQHFNSTVHQFQEVVTFSDDAVSQFKRLLLSSITQLGRNGVHDFFAASHCKVLWMVLEEQ